MENRYATGKTVTQIQGDGFPIGQPVAHAAPRNGGQPVNPYFSGAQLQGKTSSASTSPTPFTLSPQESDKILHEAVDTDLTSANIDVVHGDDFEGPLPPNFAQAGPPVVNRKPVEVLTRAQNTRASHATFSFVGGNRYRSGNQTQGPPSNNARST